MWYLKDKALDVGRYLIYFIKTFSGILILFITIGLLLDYVAGSWLPPTGILKTAIKTLADALILAVPLGSLTGFVIDRNLTLIANCSDLGLRGIYRHKRDEAAVRLMQRMIKEAEQGTKQSKRFSLKQNKELLLRIASINGNQLFHPNGELRDPFDSLLSHANIGTGEAGIRIRILLLNPFSDNALARAESEEWNQVSPLSSTDFSDQAWKCRFFEDSAVTYHALVRLKRKYPRAFEVRYSEHMPIHVFGLNDQAIVGVHNLAAVKAPSGTWHGRMPVYHHMGNLELASEAYASFDYSWNKGRPLEDIVRDMSKEETRFHSYPRAPSVIPAHVVSRFKAEPHSQLS